MPRTSPHRSRRARRSAWVAETLGLAALTFLPGCWPRERQSIEGKLLAESRAETSRPACLPATVAECRVAVLDLDHRDPRGSALDSGIVLARKCESFAFAVGGCGSRVQW